MHLPILTIFVFTGISDLLHTKNMAEIGVGLGAMCMEIFCRTEYWFTGVELQPKSLYYQIDFLSRDRFPHSKQQYEAWGQAQYTGIQVEYNGIQINATRGYKLNTTREYKS